MLHDLRLRVEFFEWLAEQDRILSTLAAAEGCAKCSGRLHKANYPRKPRGGGLAELGKELWKRHSLCCGREGCRRRTLPPSLRFLGRRVYVEAVVLVASVMALVFGGTGPSSRVTSVPARTLGRWLHWWREEFPRSVAWQQVQRSVAPPLPEAEALPRSLYQRLEEELSVGGSPHWPRDICEVAALLLAPSTTSSATEASRLVRLLRRQSAMPRVTQKMA